MIRQTSIEAYRTIKEQGLLSRWQFAVYSAIFNTGPMTQGECWSRHFPDIQRHNVGPRFAELEKMGVLTTTQKRPCALTGKNAYVWDVTDRLPVKLEHKKEKWSAKVCKTHLTFVKNGYDSCHDSQTSLFPCEVVKMVESA